MRSVYADRIFDQEGSLDSKMLVFHELVKTAKVYVRDATTISPYALLLFGGLSHSLSLLLIGL